MVEITFLHARDVFNDTKFKKWIYKIFPNARFEGFEWGNWFPTLSIPYGEFHDGHKMMPQYAQKKIASLKCSPNVFEYLVFGVYPINRITNLYFDFEKITGREPYGKVVEEIIDVN